MKSTNRLKHFFRKVTPFAYQYFQEVLTRHRARYVAKRITSQAGWAVQSGPFEGMRYVQNAVGSTLTPKLIGSYESELQPRIRKILETKYQKVIDIGCAEGYYAVGIALMSRNSEIHAFDINANALALCKQMANLNGVGSRVITHLECTPTELNALATPGSLIICDCEGCELALLDPTIVPNLANCDLLVELHDMLVPGLTSKLIPRFSATHKIQFIDTCDRDVEDYPILKQFSTLNKRVAVAELRDGPMQWAFMSATVSSGSS